MLEIWNASIAWPNLPITVLLGLVLIYWLGVIIGALDLDMFQLGSHADLDVDMDLDLDMDMDMDMDASAELDGDMDAQSGHHEMSVFGSIATFMNLDKIPLTVVFSFLITMWWALAIIFYHFFINEASVLAWAIHLLNFTIAVGLTKIATMPMVFVYKALGGDVNDSIQKGLGQVGTLDFDCSEDHFSQAVVDTGGAPLIFKVKSIKGFIPKGSRVVLVERGSEGDFYFVQKLT